jgi:NTP pyrophosphatase (non-canonical NTP hydrolase)
MSEDRSIDAVLLAGVFMSADAATKRLTISGLQSLIAEMYSQKDAARGVDGTFMWLMEEVGELASALRQGSPDELAAEFADVLAWLVTIANVAHVDLEQALLKKYGGGCPGCGQMVCRCDVAEKP